MKKRKIVLIIKNYSNGGSERRASVLANEFVKLGYEAVIMAAKKINRDVFYKDNKAEVVFLPEYAEKCDKKQIEKAAQWADKRKKYLRRIRKLPLIGDVKNEELKEQEKHISDSIPLRLYIENNPDAVFVAFSAELYIELFAASKGLRCGQYLSISTLVEQLMDTYQRENQKNAVCNLIAKSNGCIFQTNEQFDYFRKRKIALNGTVIHNPIDSSFLPKPYVGERKKTIVNFCRIHPAKNLSLLINSFSLLVSEYTGYRLEIYGVVVSEEEKEKLEKLIMEKNLSDSVKILPARSDIHKVIADYAMFVSSSDYEGISNSMLEAMAMGMPTVCTDCDGGGAKEIIRDGENGLIVPKGNAEALYKAMKRVIEEPTLADKIGNNAYRIREELSIDKIAKEWINALNEKL